MHVYRVSSCIFICIAALYFFGACNRPRNQRPNIVILFTDDQGTLDAGCYGADDLHTPHIDRLSRSGVRFTRAYAHTVCCPSRAALLTGRHPQRSGIRDWTQNNPHDKEKGLNLPLSEVTIAEILKDSGYRTGLFGKWHLGAALENGPLEQGFDTFFGHRSGFIDNYVHYFLHGRGFHDLWSNKEEIFVEDSYFPSLMTERAVSFIEENSKRPFFLYMAFNLPHYPEQPDSLFVAANDELTEPRRSYATVVSTVDDKIGQIINKLEELSLRENTLVIFMSDNGHSTEETFIRIEDHASGLPKGTNYCANGGGGYTGKWRGAKASFLEGGIRVPAIVSYPGRFPENVTRDQVISVMDFFPTICDLIGASLPGRPIDGHSLIPIIDSNGPSNHEKLFFEWRNQWAVIDGKWKLILNGRDTTGEFSPHPQKEEKMETPYLANLDDEHPEEKNYASERPEIVKRLSELIDKWEEDVFIHLPVEE
jgi:arylsulfatase A